MIKQEQLKLDKASDIHAGVMTQIQADKLAIMTISSIVKLCATFINEPINSDYVEVKMSHFSNNIGTEIQKQLINDRTEDLLSTFKKQQQAK